MRKRLITILRVFALGAAALLTAACVLFLASSGGGASLGGVPSGQRLERMQSSLRWHGGRFENDPPVSTMGSASALDAVRAYFDRGGPASPEHQLPLEDPAATTSAAPPGSSGLRITWLGHSSALFEIDGARVLADPMFSERASPSTLVGPSRFHPFPTDPGSLLPLDAVVISHDHYDHLDMASVRRLALAGVPFHVPLGVGAHLQRWGVPAEQIREHDWWEETEVAGVRLVATPSQHFSGRGLFDGNATLWSSWSLVGPRHRAFFSGDTGLTPLLGEVGERLGPFDVVLLEIGAFHPAWGSIHLGPHGALEAFRLLRGETLLPIHWGTFDLGPHPWDEPIERLWADARDEGIRLLTPVIGAAFEPAHAPAPTPWWRGH